MAMGLIAAALGGAGKALSSIGEMEAKKQNEAKLRRELMDMESEERLRLDEITFGREMERAPIRAKTTAEANVLGEAAGYKAAERAGLPKIRAAAKVGEKTSQYAAEDEAGLTTIEAKREADRLKAGITAKSEAGLPKAEADYAADKRLEEIRAVTEKNLFKEEADLLAKQELAKVQAMTAQGVPEAEAKLLSAKWKAQKTQRDEAAAEKTQQEMNDLITKMKDPNYKKAVKTKEGLEVTGSLILQANRDKKDKTDRARNTIEMERQIKETEKEMGRILGIGDPKKIPDEINYLESQAKKGKQDAIDKLAKLKPLNDELNNLSRDLRSYKRGGSDADSSSGSGNKPSIESFNK